MLRDELNRLLFKATENAAAPEMGLMQVEVSCDGNAGEVIARASEALCMILSVHLVCGDEEEWLTDSSYELLETWFENNVLVNLQDENVNRDTEEVRRFGDGRDWFWWSARVIDNNRLLVYILLTGFPVSGFDSLRWLLQCAGALRVEQGPAL